TATDEPSSTSAGYALIGWPERRVSKVRGRVPRVQLVSPERWLAATGPAPASPDAAVPPEGSAEPAVSPAAPPAERPCASLSPGFAEGPGREAGAASKAREIACCVFDLRRRRRASTSLSSLRVRCRSSVTRKVIFRWSGTFPRSKSPADSGTPT